jgi:uncharacterized membrane protein YdbT with pleckstrin-like domain
MSYIKNNLMPNEKILFTARVHPAVFLPSIVSFISSIAFVIYTISTESKGDTVLDFLPGFLGAGIFFFYSIVLGLQALIIMLTTEFAVTNRRVIAKTGFIRRHTLEILLPKIESVSVNQDILGRLLNFGTVTVTGTGGTKESFRAIVDPIGVRKKINQIIEGYMQYQQKLSARQAGG